MRALLFPMLALAWAAAAQAELPTVAVLPLRPLGVKADAALALESTLRAEVGRLPEVKLASPEAVKRALRAEPDCIASLSCVAGAASAAGASHLLVGTVSELGDVYMLDVKLLDARSGSELRRVSRPISGAKDRLIEAVRAAAVELLAPARYAGGLYVEALEGAERLPGAELFLDGKPAGRTPLEKPLEGLSPGQHALRISREGEGDFGVFVEVRFERITVAQVDVGTRSVVRVGFLTDDAARALILEANRPRPAPGSPEVAPPAEPAAPLLAVPLLVAVPQPAPRSAFLRIAGFSGLGLAVVSTVVGVAFHARAYATAADLNRREQDNHLTASDIPSYGDIDREVKTARIFYGASALLGLVGGAALFYDRYLDQHPTPPQVQSAWRAQPILPAGGAGMMLSRSF